MNLRTYRSADTAALLALFFSTVHTACAKDYTPAQLDAWAPKQPDSAAWSQSFCAGKTLLAEEDGHVLGFGAIHPDGYLDLLYVDSAHQGRGVGSILCDFLETSYPVNRVTVHASMTARPFFEGRGYHVVKAREVARRGQQLTNFVMEKEL